MLRPSGSSSPSLLTGSNMFLMPTLVKSFSSAPWWGKMKKPIQKLTEAELSSYPIHDLVDGWFFRVDEISFGFYKVEGIECWGRMISRMGTDPDQLLCLCKKDIEDKA
jgi:hypothetical protein